MLIEITYKDIEIKIFTDKQKVHLTKYTKEPLSLNKLMKIRNHINKVITKQASEYDVIVFNAA
jgi:hypothetical protein